MSPKPIAAFLTFALLSTNLTCFAQSYDLERSESFSQKAIRSDSYESAKFNARLALEGNLVADPSPVYVVYGEGRGSKKKWVAYNLTSPSARPAFVLPESRNPERRYYLDDPRPLKKGPGFLRTMFGTVLGTVLPPVVGAAQGLVSGTVFGFVTGFIPGALIGGVLGTAKGLIVGTAKGAMNLVCGTGKALWRLFHGRLL